MTISPFYSATAVQELSNTTGTGTYVLMGAVNAYKSFSSAYSTNTLVPYTATDGTNFEWGVGTYTTGYLARTTILGSSNSNAAVAWVNTVNIFVGIEAELQPFQPMTNDPTNPFGGQTWYNTTTQTYKGFDGYNTKTFYLA
jgi:hypothetical protein